MTPYVAGRWSGSPFRWWMERWGGPAIVLTLIVVGTLVAGLVLGELRPGGFLDVTLRGGGYQRVPETRGGTGRDAPSPAGKSIFAPQTQAGEACQPPGDVLWGGSR